MTDVKSLLIATIETVVTDVYLQGTAPERYPESFATFWVSDVPDGGHYDDAVSSYDWEISVIYYSQDPDLVFSEPEKIKNALSAAGFIPQGRGRDIQSDKPEWTGWAMDFLYVERT